MKCHQDHSFNIAHIISGSIYLTCAAVMILTGVISLLQVRRRQSFSFLKIQITLIIVFGVSVIFNGLFLLNIEAFNFWCAGEQWYKVLLGIAVEYSAGLSLSLLFWNLSHTYWVSAKSLQFLMIHFDNQ